MALIPADVGLRLRLDNELQTQAVAPIKEIPEDLAHFKTGQLFSARIQETLPENTYRALVAGKTITLSLPETVKAGDLLELVVVDRTPKSLIAQLAPQQANTAQISDDSPYPHASFSPAAKMLGKLLVAEGHTPQAAALNRGEALLSQAPRTGAELAPALHKAVNESGLFYESHQAQWLAGKLPLKTLLQEPQGRLSSLKPVVHTPITNTPVDHPLPNEATTTNKTNITQNITPNLLTQIATESQNTSNASTQTTPTATTTPSSMASIPDELRPLVQQQLDAAGTQRLIWHGEAWPGQPLRWEIEHEEPHSQTSDESKLEPWLSTLRLSTPHLGALEATVQLGPRGVRISLSAASSLATTEMRAAASQLEQALTDAGLQLLGFTVKQAAPNETKDATTNP